MNSEQYKYVTDLDSIHFDHSDKSIIRLRGNDKKRFRREIWSIFLIIGIFLASWLSSFAGGAADVHRYAEKERTWWELQDTVQMINTGVCTLAVFAVDGYQTTGRNYADSTLERHLIGTNIFDISLRIGAQNADSVQIDSGWVELHTYDGQGPIIPANGSHCFISKSDTGSTWYPKYRGKTLTDTTLFFEYRLGIVRGNAIAYVLAQKSVDPANLIVDTVNVFLTIAGGDGK